MKAFLKKLLAGAMIGIGGILPGVSGGIIAVSMGLYRRMLDAVYGFFKDPKANFIFLLPLGIGGAIGLLSTSRLVEYLMTNFRVPIMYLFIGFVAGGIPSLYKEGIKKDGFKPKYLIATAVGASLILAMAFLDTGKTGVALPFNAFTAALCGGIIATGTVIPGISTSFILIHLGLFEPLLSSLNRLDIPMLIMTAIGTATVALLLIKVVRDTFIKYPSYAYFGILGFLISSMILIFPGFVSNIYQLLYILMLIGGFIASLVLERAMEKS